MAGHSQTRVGRKRLALTLLQEQILPVALQWRVKLHWATHHMRERRTGVATQKKYTKKNVPREADVTEWHTDTENVEPYTYKNKLTCWVQAFCSRSWPATDNPVAPLNWTESQGVAHWRAGMVGAHWTALPLDQQYYLALDVGVYPPPGLRWLTGERPLLPLEDRSEKVGVNSSLNSHLLWSIKPCVTQSIKGPLTLN